MGEMNECAICKHYGRETLTPDSIERVQLFDESGRTIGVSLCRRHSIQLFQLGQKKFLASHWQILNNLIAAKDHEFIDLLRRAVKDRF